VESKVERSVGGTVACSAATRAGQMVESKGYLWVAQTADDSAAPMVVRREQRWAAHSADKRADRKAALSAWRKAVTKADSTAAQMDGWMVADLAERKAEMKEQR